MSSRVLIVCPESDVVEQALSHWASAARLALSTRPSVAVSRDLRGSLATHRRICKGLRSSDVLLYFGHGGPDHLGTAPLLTVKDGGRLRSKVVFAIACHSGRGFGREAVRKGRKAYVGLDDLLVVPITHRSFFSDPVAAGIELFFASDGTAGAAFATIRLGFEAIRDFYRTTARTDPNATIFWLAAHANAKALVLIGDATAQAT